MQTEQEQADRHMNSKKLDAAACCGMLPNPYVQLQKTGAAACCGCTCLPMSLKEGIALTRASPHVTEREVHTNKEGGPLVYLVGIRKCILGIGQCILRIGKCRVGIGSVLCDT